MLVGVEKFQQSRNRVFDRNGVSLVKVTTDRPAELLAGYRGRFCESGGGEEGVGVSGWRFRGGGPETGSLTRLRQLFGVASQDNV